jgi:3',5'-cyclic AMP phosphodiesterase CpdA
MSGALTILHASDLQCGRPFRPSAAEALVVLAHSVDPDVVVVSGDLTQRAKVREFRMASELLARLPRVPAVVTPGNHDVPLYRAWERLLSPFRNWRRHMCEELDTVTRAAGATFVALNSAAPRRAIVGGRLNGRQLSFAREAFRAAPPSSVRALVVHHHFVPTPGDDGGRPLPGARALVGSFESMGVDLVLGGHVHQTHVRTSRDLIPGDPGTAVALVACGTTTSRRGRGPERGLNTLNVIRVLPLEVQVRPHLLRNGGRTFEPMEPIILPRGRGTSRVALSEGADR